MPAAAIPPSASPPPPPLSNTEATAAAGAQRQLQRLAADVALVEPGAGLRLLLAAALVASMASEEAAR
jgi:hypothetical protein